MADTGWNKYQSIVEITREGLSEEEGQSGRHYRLEYGYGSQKVLYSEWQEADKTAPRHFMEL